ncbi:MAG: YwaF family protein [Erysipelotrichaceae bacterium]|nr:YwaF family protein [Erysipelotrichaceae bacterium]
MSLLFDRKPELFGSFHICALFLCVLFNYGVYRFFKNKDETYQLKAIHYCGLFMMVMEVIKQIFCYHFVFDHKINLWFFPWQLCSTLMYCSFFITLVKRKMQDTILVYLTTFCLLAAIVALLIPLDMLRIQVYLACYSFLYHYLMISVAIVSLFILSRRTEIDFLSSAALFLFFALIAEIINIVSHQIFHDIRVEPNMFYISPYYPTTQPILNTIALKYGIFTEIIIYLGLIILLSYLIYRMIIKKIYN